MSFSGEKGEQKIKKMKRTLFNKKRWVHSSRYIRQLSFYLLRCHESRINRFFIVLLYFYSSSSSVVLNIQKFISPYVFHSKLQNVISGYLLFVYFKLSTSKFFIAWTIGVLVQGDRNLDAFHYLNNTHNKKFPVSFQI